jgi:hypothetical protein
MKDDEGHAVYLPIDCTDRERSCCVVKLKAISNVKEA